MTLAAAQKFIQQAVNDPNLVCRINSAPDKATVQRILGDLELNFDDEEFEPAYFNVLTWCQTHDQAAAVQEVGQWWSCLSQILASSDSDEVPSETTEK